MVSGAACAKERTYGSFSDDTTLDATGMGVLVYRYGHGHGAVESVGEDPTAVEHVEEAEKTSITRILRGRRHRAGDSGQFEGSARSASGRRGDDAGCRRTIDREYTVLVCRNAPFRCGD